MKTFSILLVIIIFLAGGYYFISKEGTPAVEKESAPADIVSESDPAAKEVVFNVKSGAFYFNPNVLKVKVGQKVTVKIDSVGSMHTFTIDELGLDVKTPGGKITVVTFTPTEKGEFTFYCAITGHRQRGQIGTIVVE